ncbi:MAG: hypothetical protein ACTSPO_15660 [Candidatus Heimdallarchaeaceae archaeon]
MADINDKYVIYYSVRGYRTNQTVTISVYDTAGSAEVSSQSMTEQGTTGIYYFNFYPKKRTQYLAVMDCTEFPQKSHQVIRIEKQKISGAVTFPKVKMPAPSLKEDEKVKLFKELSLIANKIETSGIADAVNSVKQSNLEIQKRFEAALTFKGKSIEKLGSEVISKLEKERTIASLASQKTSQNNQRDFALLMDSVKKEVRSLKEAQENLINFKMVVAELVKQSDDIDNTLKLTHAALLSPEFKTKMNALIHNLDDLNLFVKNVGTKTGL